MANGTGGNLASLNVDITSNITQITQQLNALQQQLQVVQRTGVNLNTNNMSSSITNTSMLANQLANTIQLAIGGRGSMALNNALQTMNLFKDSLKNAIPNAKNALANIAPNVRSAVDSMKLGGMYTADAFKSFSNGISGIGIAWNTTKTVFSEFRAQGASIRDIFSTLNMVRTQPNGGDLLSNLLGTNTATRNFTEAFSRIRTGFQGFGSAISQGIGGTISGLGSAIGALGPIFGAVFAGIAVVSIGACIVALVKLTELTNDFVQQGLKWQSMVEQFRISFSVLMGPGQQKLNILDDDGVTRIKEFNSGLQASNALMESLQNYANYSTFTFPDLAAETQRLQAYGLSANDVMHVTRMLGDTSMGNKEKFKQQSYALAQSLTAGRLTGDNLRQFREGGFNPLQQIAEEKAMANGSTKATVKKDAQKYMPGLQEDMEAGKIGIDQIVAAFERATSKGGQFYNMQAMMADTAAGKISTIADKWDYFRGKSQGGMFESLKPILDKVIGILDNLIANVDVLSQAFETYLAPALEGVFAQLVNLFGFANGSDGFDSMTQGAVGWIQAIAAGINILSTVANVLIGVVGIFMTGIMTIAAAFVSAWFIIRVIWTTFYSLVAGIFVAIGSIVGAVALGIASAFEWVADKVSHYFAVIMNGIASKWNALADSFVGKKMGLGTWNPGFNENDVGDFYNSSFAQLEKLKRDGNDVMDSIISNAGEGYKDAYEQLQRGAAITVPLMIKSAEMTGAAWENVFTKNEDLIKKLDKLKPTVKKPQDDNQKGIDAINGQKSTKDAEAAAKQFASAWDQVGKAIESAMKKLTGFDTVFSKMSYEHFSPTKMQARLDRYLKQFTDWTNNLAKLSGAGVSDGVISQLQGMGPQGFGMTQALVQASPEQRNKLLSQYGSLQKLALTPAVSSVLMEHSGTIYVKGINSKEELIGVVTIIAADMVKDKKSNSLSPALSDIFK